MQAPLTGPPTSNERCGFVIIIDDAGAEVHDEEVDKQAGCQRRMGKRQKAELPARDDEEEDEEEEG